MTPVAAPEAPTGARQAGEFDTDHGTRGGEQKGIWEQIALALFIGIPFLAVLAAVPIAWGGLLGWRDIVIAAVFYTVSGHGISIGFHRYFTHKSFKPNRPLKYALAIAGSLAIEGPVVRWVADHRKHHKFSDREGDPHSPWKYGTSFGALTKGFLHAHIGWLFDTEQTPQRQYAPDLLKDRDIVKVSRMFPFLVLGLAVRAGCHRRPLVVVDRGRADRVLLGQPGPDRAAAPRHLVDQLDLPHDRRAAVQEPGQVGQRLVAGDSQPG